MASNQWKCRVSRQNIMYFSMGLVANQRYQCLVQGSIFMRSTKRYHSLPHLELILCPPLWVTVMRKVEPIQEDTPILRKTKSMHKIQGTLNVPLYSVCIIIVILCIKTMQSGPSTPAKAQGGFNRCQNQTGRERSENS